MADLKEIVQRMMDAGESEENIGKVIQHFKAQEPAPYEGQTMRARAGRLATNADPLSDEPGPEAPSILAGLRGAAHPQSLGDVLSLLVPSAAGPTLAMKALPAIPRAMVRTGEALTEAGDFIPRGLTSAVTKAGVRGTGKVLKLVGSKMGGESAPMGGFSDPNYGVAMRSALEPNPIIGAEPPPRPPIRPAAPEPGPPKTPFFGSETDTTIKRPSQSTAPVLPTRSASSPALPTADEMSIRGQPLGRMSQELQDRIAQALADSLKTTGPEISPEIAAMGRAKMGAEKLSRQVPSPVEGLQDRAQGIRDLTGHEEVGYTPSDATNAMRDYVLKHGEEAARASVRGKNQATMEDVIRAIAAEKGTE